MNRNPGCGSSHLKGCSVDLKASLLSVAAVGMTTRVTTCCKGSEINPRLTRFSPWPVFLRVGDGGDSGDCDRAAPADHVFS